MRQVAALLVVLLAGCSGAVGPGATQSPTVTPAPIPSETATDGAEASRLPDGVTVRGGVTEAWAMTTRSAELLSNRSHTVRVVEETRYANGSLRWRLERVRRAGTGRALVVETHTGHDRPGWTFTSAERVAVYTEHGRDPTEGRAYWAVTDDGETIYETFDAVGRANSRRLFQLLSRFDTRVTGRVVRNATTLYRIEAEPRGEPRQMKYVDRTERARNVSLSLLVDSAGVIHEWRVSYTMVADGREVRYRRVERVTAIGQTSVAAPDWVSRLREDTATAEGRVPPADDGADS